TSTTASVLINATPKNATAPSFASRVIITAANHPSSVAAADINHDGRPDLIVTDQSRNTVGVLLNGTAGPGVTPSFGTQVDFAVSSAPDFVTTGDLNGDGRPDLVIADYDSNAVTVLLNRTDAGEIVPSMAPKQTLSVNGPATSLAL